MDEYDLFCENMKRYENGERGLNADEIELEKELSNFDDSYSQLPFSDFLDNMKKYEKEDINLHNYVKKNNDSYSRFLENMKIYKNL